MKQMFFVFLMVFNLSSCLTQVPTQRGYCENPEFDAKVERMISFSVPTVSVEDLENLDGAIIADARELEEFQTSHIPGAKYVGYKDFDFNRLAEVPKDAPIVLYCSIGYRSEKIGEKLMKKGYTNVYNLYGSIFEWVNQGNTVVDQSNKPTQKVHTYNAKWSKWVEDGKAEEVW